MKPHHLLVALLVLANVLGGGALAAVVYTLKEHWPDTFAVVTLGVGLGQLALVAGWFAWGRWHVVFRAGVLLATILAWLFPLAQCTGDERHAARWGGILLVYGICVALPLAMVRLLGHTILLDGQLPGAAAKVRPWQFTVGGVLSLTTLAAILLGAARHLDFPWMQAVPAIMFCAATALGAVACIYLAFRAGPAWIALGGPPLIAALVGYLLRFTLFPPQPYDALIFMSFFQGATIAISAAVLRTAGYRLARGTSSGIRENSEHSQAGTFTSSATASKGSRPPA